eukprot:CAMPEP_0206185308 /NCGR_PEP_ID=MMETSP0166-20121206/1727_1 /ASSEMBLY_ACC=CAM_ASM_000260 /TAXON_ID=95228 /ORGANISM="Vannella robusta, Strain DIVA3 518/3/11/1/6" /LENGTH=283 /DNA_ID=CAMNT_0053600471 /DNA_START=781 /DNA_END=1629 /DNA_ORIENTATION=+
MSSPFDESKFNEDVFSAPSFKERERIIEEKRKMFEESESEEFKRNKQKMLDKLKETREASRSTPPETESYVEEVTEIPDDKIEKPQTPEQAKNEEEDEESEDEILTIDEIESLVEQAMEHKAVGNEYYKEGLWEAAIGEYTKALQVCPKSSNSRAVFYGNRAACWRNLLEYEKTIEDCTKALKYDEKYERVLLRRADAYERLEKLSEALEDYKKILEINPQSKLARKSVQSLPQQIQVKQEREKEEMMGKLKEVGNSLLGLVGLSLDNFQFNQDPNTGGYSVN